MRVGVICPTHGYVMEEVCKPCEKVKFESEFGTFVPFTPHLFQDLGPEPIYIDSKKRLREECKKRNLIAARLL